MDRRSNQNPRCEGAHLIVRPYLAPWVQQNPIVSDLTLIYLMRYGVYQKYHSPLESVTWKIGNLRLLLMQALVTTGSWNPLASTNIAGDDPVNANSHQHSDLHTSILSDIS